MFWKRWQRIDRPLTGLVFLALVLRLLHLGRHDLWYDEAYALFPALSVPDNAPLFFVFIGLWTRPLFLLGIAPPAFEFICRLPSVLFSVGAVVVLYRLVSRVFGRPAALVAVLIQALSPWHLWYAQEMRPYALALLLSLLAMNYLVLWVGSSPGLPIRYAAASIVFFTLSVYTHYFCIFLWPLQLIYLWRSRRGWREVRFALLPGLFFLPWVPVFLSQGSAILKGFWPVPPGLSSLRVTAENFLLGYHGTRGLYLLADGLLLLLAVVLLRGVARDRDAGVRSSILLFACSCALPVLGVFLFSCFLSSVYIDRIFIVLTPYLYALMGAAILRLPRRPWRGVVLGVLVSVLVLGDVRYFTDRMFCPADPTHHIGVWPKKPFRPLVSYLRKIRLGGEALVFSHPAPCLPVGVYADLADGRVPSSSRTPFFYAYDPSLKDTMWRRPYPEVYGRFKDVFIPKGLLLSRVTKGGGRVYLVGSDWGRSGSLDENSRSIKEFLDRHLRGAGRRDFDGVWVFAYDVVGGKP